MIADRHDMIDAVDPTEPDAAADMPYLPPAVYPTPVQPPAPAGPASALPSGLHTSPTSPGPLGADAPPAPAFDAKAMVAAQKHFTASPVYGAIPKPTAESLAAAEALRIEAKRIRGRNKALGWSIAVALVGGIGAAGLLGYHAYQTDQGRQAAARAERAAAREAAEDAGELPGAFTPLGAQNQVVDLLDDVNSAGATPSAGGLLGAVADAQAAVDDVNGTKATDDDPSAAPGVLDASLVEPIIRLGARLDDLDGFERYVIDAGRWTADSPATYTEFVAAVQSLTQSEPESNGFAVLPPLRTGEIGLAMRRDGSQLLAVVISSTDPEIHVIAT